MKATRREILALAAMGALSAWPASAETASQSDEAQLRPNQADFDQVWELVRDRFYDPRLNGLDWQEQRSALPPCRRRLRAPGRRRRPSSTRCWASSAPPTRITTRRRIRPITSSPDIFVGRARASRPRSGLPQRRSLLSGHRRVHRGRRSRPYIRHRRDRGRARACGRRSASATKSCRSTIARSVPSTLSAARSVSRSRSEIRRASGAAPIAISVTPADLQPNEMFLRGLKASARVIATGDAKIGYVHVWSYASRQDSVRARGPDVRRTAQGRRRAGLGSARRMGRRAAGISRPVQPARANDEDHGPQRRDRLRRRQMAQARRRC